MRIMNYLKKGLIVLLFALFGLQATAFAATIPFADVPEDAWYAGSVAENWENGLMAGTSETAFSPNAPASRAMLATILYRMADGPVTSATTAFQDVAENAWYSYAVNWAVNSDLIAGYGDGRFGVQDTVTREQLAAILWRYAGRPTAEQGQTFVDEQQIASYASEAVDWARQNGIMNGKPGNTFDPQDGVTRAELAAVLCNYRNKNAESPASSSDNDRRALVVYFSASGNTARVANYIADAVNADTLELVPVDAYTDEDLDWTREGSRVNREHENKALRQVALVVNTVENWDSYDTVFIGYPIWWGIAAWPVNDFVEANDFTGKTVIPFCTSSSSGLGESGRLLAELAETGDWLGGERFSSGTSVETIQAWIAQLGL